jgi:hypothetical protein
MERRVIGKILGSPCIKDWCLFAVEYFSRGNMMLWKYVLMENRKGI